MIRLRKTDLVIGRPLAYPVFDRDRHLLLRAGAIVGSEQQLAEIGKRGLYRSPDVGAPMGTRAENDDRDAPERDDTWQKWKLHELRLPMGTRMSLQKLDPGDDTRYSASLLGLLRDVSLIVDIPSAGGKLAMFRQGQPLLLRVFNGTRVFAFTGSVLFIRYSPGAYLHVEWPKTVDGTEVRSRDRIKVRLIAVASRDVPGQDAEPQTVTLEDLSAGGARLIAAQPLGDLGAEITLAFRLKTGVGEATLKLRAILRTVGVPGQAGPGHAYGVQFVGVDPMEHLALEGFVHQQAESKAGVDAAGAAP